MLEAGARYADVMERPWKKCKEEVHPGQAGWTREKRERCTLSSSIRAQGGHWKSGTTCIQCAEITLLSISYQRHIGSHRTLSHGMHLNRHKKNGMTCIWSAEITAASPLNILSPVVTHPGCTLSRRLDKRKVGGRATR